METRTKNTPKKIAPFAVLIVLAGLLLASGQHGSRVNDPQAGLQSDSLASNAGSSPWRYVYLLDIAARYLKIDAQSQQVVTKGSLWDSPPPISLCPNQFSSLPGCLVGSVQHDRQTGLIYAVVLVRPNENADDERYWILALKLPGFELISRKGPLDYSDYSPVLLLDPADQALLVWHERIARYRVPSFTLLGEESNPRGTELSEGAYWMREGKLIDRYRVLDKKGRILKRVHALDVLTNPAKQKLRLPQRLAGRSQRDFDATYADSAAGRMLFVVGWDTFSNPVTNGSGFLIYDVTSERLLSAFNTPYRAAPADPTHFDTPTAHLTPNGELVVIEEYEWRQSEREDERDARATSSNQLRFKTGKIAIYDVQRGELMRTLVLDPAPGFLARVIGFSPEGRLMYYGSRDHIYAVDLTGSTTPKALPKVEGFSPNQGLIIFFSEH